MEAVTRSQNTDPKPASHTPSKVFKRDGSPADFDLNRIRSAIARAGKATGEFEEIEAELLCAQVLKVMSYRHADGPPHIETIQDVVEQVLISNNHLRTARSYIAYRAQHARLREQSRVLMDVGQCQMPGSVANTLTR